MKIIVLAGGLSQERDVSLLSGAGENSLSKVLTNPYKSDIL